MNYWDRTELERTQIEQLVSMWQSKRLEVEQNAKAELEQIDIMIACMSNVKAEFDALHAEDGYCVFAPLLSDRMTLEQLINRHSAIFTAGTEAWYEMTGTWPGKSGRDRYPTEILQLRKSVRPALAADSNVDKSKLVRSGA